MFVVDTQRYNDCDEGLVGPFDTEQRALDYIATIPNKHDRNWAAVRPITPPLLTAGPRSAPSCEPA